VALSPQFLAILPEALILLLGVLVLILDPFWKPENRRTYLGGLTAGGLFAILAVSLIWTRPGASVPVWGGMLRYDWFAFIFKIMFVVAAAMTALLMMDVDRLGTRAEAYVLLLASLIGMDLMAASNDLVMLFLAVEVTSIPLYVLSGFILDDDFSVEAGFKYLLFGAMATAVLLYGLSLVYGLAGATGFEQAAGVFQSFNVLAMGVILLILVGLAFKIAAVPFHFWSPDVYQGAPTPVAGFLSTASKAAGFAALIRLFIVVFPQISVNWSWVLAIVAVLTMTIGNLIALAQKNVKRMLAYSSIAHAGYALIGVVAYQQMTKVGGADTGSAFGTTSVIYYLLAYLLTNLAAFGAVIAYGRHVGSDEYEAYSGLSRRSPALALVLLVAMLSLAGMPPFGGFIGKVLVFMAGVDSGWIWLVIIGIINSAIGLYYYLNLLKYIYLFRAPNEEDEKIPLPISRPYMIALVGLVVGVIVVGVLFAPWYDVSARAAASLMAVTAALR
jgi:NADH-quinone oxidoreductase subunit N